MALKKSDLYSSLWASCDELRGGMDASQYKDYVLFMLFIKYISDKYAAPILIVLWTGIVISCAYAFWKLYQTSRTVNAGTPAISSPNAA